MYSVEQRVCILWLAQEVANTVLASYPMYIRCAAALAQLLVLPREGNHGAVVKHKTHLAEGFSGGLEGTEVATPLGCK